MSVYSGHKRFYCLIYLTMTTPDGLNFGFYGPEVRISHDKTLLADPEWEQILEEALLYDGNQFYV